MVLMLFLVLGARLGHNEGVAQRVGAVGRRVERRHAPADLGVCNVEQYLGLQRRPDQPPRPRSLQGLLPCVGYVTCRGMTFASALHTAWALLWCVLVFNE